MQRIVRDTFAIVLPIVNVLTVTPCLYIYIICLLSYNHFCPQFIHMYYIYFYWPYIDKLQAIMIRAGTPVISLFIALKPTLHCLSFNHF